MRLASLKELRAVAQCESLDHHAFLPLLRTLEHPMINSLKDLRSQVVREACVTVSGLAATLGSDFAPFSELILPTLLTLLPNSAKVMATSAEVCLKFIIKVRMTNSINQLSKFIVAMVTSVAIIVCGHVYILFMQCVCSHMT